MSFISAGNKGTVYAPGHFLAHEECERKTFEIPQSLAETTAEGTKYVPMGTPYPSNDGECVGLVYEDVDVTVGNMPGSVVVKGVVLTNRLPVALDDLAVSKLGTLGFTFTEDPTVTRPY